MSHEYYGSADDTFCRHTVVFDMLLPVMLSMSLSDSAPSLPFKFTGGFGLSSSMVGLILGLQAIYNMFYQLLAAPPLIRRFGNLRMFRFLSITYPFLYIVTPYLILLPPIPRLVALGLVIIWKVSYGSLAYLSVTLLVTHSAPSLLVLGLVNGVAASAASLARGIGPTMFGAIHSITLEHGYGSIAWLVAAGIAVLGAVETIWLRNPEEADHQAQEEAERDPAHAAAIEDARRRASFSAPEAAAGGLTIVEVEEEDAAIMYGARESAVDDCDDPE